MVTWPGVVNRLLFPVVLFIGAVLLILLGDGDARSLGIALLGVSAGIPVPQTLTGLLRAK